ncbi:MAG: hypothetical protein FJ149_08765 [Euryarchaeota archaeon]|nr:hypothetical protein [Euryarchaeota archaeon]
MAVNSVLVLLGALSLAGVGLGAATFSQMPCGASANGGCGANGYCPGGQAAADRGACGPQNPVCNQTGGGSCPQAGEGGCPYTNLPEGSG